MRKIVDEQAENQQIRLSVPVIFDTIKRSNSSLNRKPKKLLEDSLERVLEVVKIDVLGEEDEDDLIEGDFEGLSEQPAQVCHIRRPATTSQDDWANPPVSKRLTVLGVQ